MIQTLVKCAAMFFVALASLPAQTPAPDAEAAASVNAYALDLYALLREADTNFVFSPYSQHRLLSLVLDGAGGSTAAEMQKILHTTEDAALRGQTLAALSQSLGAAAAKASLALESKTHLWVTNTASLEPAFVAAARDVHRTVPEALSFTDPAKAVRSMNAAIAVGTHGRIVNLLPASAVQADTSFVLANTVFFKGFWAAPFPIAKTQPRPFHALKKLVPVSARMMVQTHEFAYWEDDSAQVLDMPFRSENDSFSMLFLLPKAQNGIAELEKRLDANFLGKATKALSLAEATVILPRFSFSARADYTGFLVGLGARTLFDPHNANLQGIAKVRGMHLSGIWHEATIDVTEQGAEATAATMGPAAPFGEGPQIRRVVFNADHPFIFIIRHRSTGLILFIGRFASP